MAWAQNAPPPTQLFAFVDARENVLSKQVPPTRTGTNRGDFGIPAPLHEFGDDVPVATGLGSTLQSYCWTAFKLLGRGVPVEPSRDPREAMLAVAPKQPGERPGNVVVITEWWEDGYDHHQCRKALTAYVVGPGGAVLATSSAADHACLTGWGKNAWQQREELFGALLNTPSMAAALRGQLAAPPVTAPPPTSASAPAACSAAQVAKLKSYGLSDDDVRRACAGKQ